MIVIILVIGIIIVWRLGILFPENTTELASSTENLQSESIDTLEISKSKSKEDSQEELEEKSEIINISIPKGSPTSNIGNILLDNKLINSVNDFQQKVDELNLERALR